MNPWPDNNSVLVVNNCRIHYNDALMKLVQNAGEQMVPSHVCVCLFADDYFIRVFAHVSAVILTRHEPDQGIIQHSQGIPLPPW